MAGRILNPLVGLQEVAQRIGRLHRQLLAHTFTDAAQSTQAVGKEQPDGVGAPELRTLAEAIQVGSVCFKRTQRSEHAIGRRLRRRKYSGIVSHSTRDLTPSQEQRLCPPAEFVSPNGTTGIEAVIPQQLTDFICCKTSRARPHMPQG